jgi:hypothetical protein
MILARIPASVLRILKYTIWFDAICIFLALIATILSIIRFSGNFSYPLWVVAPWSIALVLLSIICIIHLTAYTPLIFSQEEKENSSSSNNDMTITSVYAGMNIVFIIGSSLEFLYHHYGWLSIEILVCSIILLIVDILFGMSRISAIRRERDLVSQE